MSGTTRISIDSAYDPIEVDFWGALFETRAMPRSKARKARVLGGQIEKLMAAEPATDEEAEKQEEELITKFGELFDVKLAAVAGGRRKPSSVLRENWEADKLTAEMLAAFLGKLMVAERKQMLDDIGEFVADPTERPT